VLTNEGNQTETDIPLTLTNDRADEGWTAVTFEDTNGTGVFDTGDQIITSVTSLAPGESTFIFVRVFAPSTAALSVVNLTTLTATFDGGADSVFATDRTIVNPFNVDVIKEQALDANCDSTPETTFTADTFQINPGDCVVYRVIAQNNSADSVFNVVITDATPAFTSYAATQPTVRCVPNVCTFISEPVAGSSGTVEAAAGTILAGAQVELFFTVELEALSP